MINRIGRGSQDTMSSQAHLVAGMYKLEDLRQAFIEYLDAKEAEVQARQAAGTDGKGGAGTMHGSGSVLSEWL